MMNQAVCVVRMMMCYLLLAGVGYVCADNSGDADSALGTLQYLRAEESLSIDHVRDLAPDEWTSVSADEANFGFDQAHYWFRVPVIPYASNTDLWLLKVAYPLLDTLQLYLYLDDSLVQSFAAGDHLEFDKRPVDFPSFAFPLMLKENRTYWLYAHVYTGSSVQLPLSLQPEAMFWQDALTENAFSVAFYAVLISMLIYNAILFFMVRERSYLYYVLYLAAFVMLMASMDGFAYQFLWPDFPSMHEVSVVLFMNCILITAPLFCTSFLRLASINMSLHRLLMLIPVIGVLGIGASLLMPYQVVVKMTSLMGAITTFSMMGVTIYVMLKAYSREVLIFISAWIALMLGYVFYIAQKLGWLPINNLTEHSIEVGAVIEVLLLALGLAEKINSERKKRMVAQQQMLDVQLQANQELDVKVRERTEELERLNDKLKEASVTDALTQVKNRRYFDNKLAAEYHQAFVGKHWISLLMIDIDYFKQFNDTHGHQAGDLVLQKVAKQLEKEVRLSGDVVCRYGGEEFSVLLLNAGADQAREIAERIRKSVSSLKIGWQSSVLNVTCSIGVSGCIPADSSSSEGLVKKADDNLYKAKENGRDCVICENFRMSGD